MTRFFGRMALLRQIADLHAKAVPDHISVVGPRSMGKTSLLQEIVALHRSGSSAFAGAGTLDLRHDPPSTTEAAISRVAGTVKELLAGLQTEHRELASWIKPNEAIETVNDQLKIAVDQLASDGVRILLVLDGCDPVLQNGSIPRNLWDNLRALAQSKGLRLMTGTRAPLHQLCYNPDARTSDFFRIFYDQPLVVGPFDDEDWSDVFSTCGCGLDGSAQKELRNWTGGHPDMVDLMLERLRALGRSSLSKQEVDKVAEGILEKGSGKVEAIWTDCPEEVRGDILLLCRGEVAASEVPEERTRYLVGHGLAVKSGNKLKLSNRLIERKAAAHKADVSGIRQLFGAADAFDANVRTVLELRIGLVSGADKELTRLVQRCIRHLPEDPSAALSGARDIFDRALDLVWEAEAPKAVVPKEWLDEWKTMAVGAAGKAVERFTREREIRAEDRGGQIDLLRIATGRQGMKAVTAKVTKAAYMLIEHMKQVGDLRNHSRAVPSVTMAAGFCLSAIELCDLLAKELR